MKYVSIIFIIVLFVIGGCQQENTDLNNFVTIDITKTSSSIKELIIQDFMDVEYVVLETNDGFINQGLIMDIGEEYILVKNRVRDGHIFVYDREGRALRKINRKGQAGEEYTYITNISLDEDRKEMFISDHFLRKIIVYDLNGIFKRSFKHKEDVNTIGYRDICNFDKDNLICCDEYGKERAFVLISKQDGSIVKDLKIPFKEKKILMQQTSSLTVLPDKYATIIPYKNDLILLELSTDTVYTISPDNDLRPFLVRSPPVQSMKPELFLIFRLFSDRYYFMETIENVWDFNKNKGFNKTFFMYDNQEKKCFKYKVYNADYSIKKEIYMVALRPGNHEVAAWCPLEASQLVESYKKGELKGKLKEIAATLNEDSNPVIMLIKYKE